MARTIQLRLARAWCLGLCAVWKSLFVGFLSASVWAQEPADRNRAALIIGVGNYQSPEIFPLKGVPFDMESARRIAQGMQIPAGRIQFLRDQDATKERILTAVKNLQKQVGSNARVLVYFSGHGTRWFNERAGQCQEGLLSYDGQPITKIELAEAMQGLNLRADKVITLLDACHSQGVVQSDEAIRSLGSTLTPKFFSRKSDAQACSQISNYRTRSLVDEVVQLGGFPENFIQISSSLPDEVSFDEPGKGGVATQALRDCLLGQAQDKDRSGGISLDEVQQCAQAKVNARLLLGTRTPSQHITVSGNKRLVPVVPSSLAVLSEPTLANASPTADLTSAVPVDTSALQVPSVITAQPLSPVPPISPSDQSLAVSVSSSGQTLSALVSSDEGSVLATLHDILAQANPRRQLDFKATRTRLRIGQDPLELSVRSSHDGYLYLLLLGSDQKSFYLLYPNELDKDNRIVGGKTVILPRPQWSINAAGPVGVNHVLALVSDSPRPLGRLSAGKGGGSEPFTYTFANMAGRSEILEFLTVAARATPSKAVPSPVSEAFAAQLLRIEEVLP